MTLQYGYVVCCSVLKCNTVPIPAIPILEELQVYPYLCGTLLTCRWTPSSLYPYWLQIFCNQRLHFQVSPPFFATHILMLHVIMIPFLDFKKISVDRLLNMMTTTWDALSAWECNDNSHEKLLGVWGGHKQGGSIASFLGTDSSHIVELEFSHLCVDGWESPEMEMTLSRARSRD